MIGQKKQALESLGLEDFRDGQEEIIDEVVSEDKGVLVVMPTGFGKSLIYQLPALMSEDMTIVVSPLIALMKDQVDKLHALGVKAALVNSSLTEKQAGKVLDDVENGEVKILYVAPERFNNKFFLGKTKGVKVGILAVDEAHCISRWGHDFRPAYKQLSEVIERFKPRQVIALTATATRKVQGDICESLNLPGARRFIRSVRRPNLRLGAVESHRRLEDITEAIKGYIQEGGATGIIYTTTRKEAQGISAYLKGSGVASSFYHAGLKDDKRAEIQDKWSEYGGIIVATCAFGMGIDKPDVRFVIHSGLSMSIEDWYQEIGRAGRDGLPSSCLSFYDMKDDYRTLMFLIDVTNPSGNDVQMFWGWMSGVARASLEPGDDTALINMTQKEMGEYSRCYNVGGCISFLKREGMVETLGRGKYSVKVDSSKTFDFSAIEQVRQGKIDKLNEVVSIYRDRGCRVSYVCDYFGDASSLGGCGTCDNCLS